MNNILKYFFKAKNNVRLSQDERSAMRARLVSFIATKPVRVVEPPRPQWQRSPFAILNLKPAMPFILALAILFAAGGGVSLAAEKSLPGDMLHPVKIGVNEEVRAALSLSSESKTDWEARRAERRLEEAELLEANAELNEEVLAHIEENFSAHAQRVAERIARMEEKGKADAALEATNNFEASLRAHERILARFSGSVGTEVDADDTEVDADADTDIDADTEEDDNTEGEEDEDADDDEDENTGVESESQAQLRIRLGH